jgi:hypothetical protein
LVERDVDLAEDADDEQIDLLVEMVSRCIEDDDDRKTPMYAGVIAWIRTKSPSRMAIRIVGEAVQSLSYVELVVFITKMKGRENALGANPRKLIDPNVLKNRVSSVGLAEGGTIEVRGSPTKFGKVLNEFVRWEELDLSRLEE